MPERRFTISPIPSFAELQQLKVKDVDDGESQSNLVSVYSLSDEDSADSDELDEKEVERLSLVRPQKRSADSQPSSSQSTPTKKGKTTTAVYGQEVPRWSDEENIFIVNHLIEVHNQSYLQACLGRHKADVTQQVNKILMAGLAGVKKGASTVRGANGRC